MGACSPTISASLCSPAATFRTRQSPGHFGGRQAQAQARAMLSWRHMFFLCSTCLEPVGGGVGRFIRMHEVERVLRCTRKRPYRGARAGFLAEILHNQVLISASIAGFSAQIFKPFTSDGANKGFNWKLLLTSGGMPSSHSAAIVAVATAIGMERGLADSIFGLSAVVAGIVMYDAQGVRRAVGEQAQIINWILLNQLPVGVVASKSESAVSIYSSSTMVDQELAYLNKDDKSTSSENKNVGSMVTQAGLSKARLNSFNTSRMASGTGHSKSGAGEIYGSSETDKLLESCERQACAKLETPYGWRPTPLKESVGHTTLEVGAGALYGFIVALAAHIALQ